MFIYLLLIWQVSPVHPGGQEQLNDPLTSSVKQVPPCWQGAVAQTLSTTSQLAPEKPSGQTHRYSLGFLLTHVAPFWHTWRVPQGFKSIHRDIFVIESCLQFLFFFYLSKQKVEQPNSIRHFQFSYSNSCSIIYSIRQTDIDEVQRSNHSEWSSD